MTYRPSPKYASKNAKEGAWATCDRCGLLDNLPRLQWQYDFMGGSTRQRTGYLYCPRCLDGPDYQKMLFIIPADPPPLMNVRPEPYNADETNWLSTVEEGGSSDGDIIATDADVPITTNIPNPNDEGYVASVVLTATLSYAGSLTVAYLDLFNGDPATTGTSILEAITGSATRADVFSVLEEDGQDVFKNPRPIEITSDAEANANVTYVAIYSAATAGTLLASAEVGATSPTIVASAVVQFAALGLQIAQV